MGLIDRILKQGTKGKICQNCGHLIWIKDDLPACRAHDKIIMPEYPPYSGNSSCPDFISRIKDEED